MQLKIKNLEVTAGGPLVCMINQSDAQIYDLHDGDRVRLKTKKASATAIVNLSKTIIKKGQIGLFKALTKKLECRTGQLTNINISEKPISLQYIKKKLNGNKISAKEIDAIVKDIVENNLSDVELTYFVSACYTHIMDMEETVALTKSMINNGIVLKLDKYPVIDKHCVGGVAGNRTTMLVVPIIAAAGLTIPKTSSRSITSPAGTADTMEVLCDVDLSFQKMKNVIKKTNGCLMWGGSINLAPADDRIIRVEHPLSIDARSQLLASIIAKKGSVSATHILFDIPIGRGAKFESRKHALSLKKDFETIGKKLGMKVKVILTDGSQPIGKGFGPVLEARDVMWALKNEKRAPKDLQKKSVHMAGLIFELAGKAKKGQGLKMAEDILYSGKAYKKMLEIIKAQGKNKSLAQLRPGRLRHDVKITKPGRITHIDNSTISKIARVAGAPKSQGAGLFLNKHVGEKVKKGEIIYTVYAESQDKLDYALNIVRRDTGIEIK